MFKQFGGIEIPSAGLGTGVGPAAQHWNFGVKPITQKVRDVISAKPSLHAMFPALQGKWDGTSTVNALDAVRKAGVDPTTLIQQQPRGTCGGRAGSETLDFLQLILMASGTRVKFHRTSHAFLYWAARKMYGMDNGSVNDENNDGVASGSIPEVLSKVGAVTREEAGDANAYGAGSDDLAVRWGCGGIDPSLAAKLDGLAADNIVTAWAPITSAAEGADGIAAGGIMIGSDSQGFTMNRDAAGFCRPSGSWGHYQIRVSVQAPGGRKGFGYWQSWGKGTPSGPALAGHTDNCFGVDYDVMDSIIRSNGANWAVVFGFPVFELEQGGRKLDWMV